MAAGPGRLEHAGQPVVEHNGIVERILTARAVDLIDRLFHGAELPLQRLAVRGDLRVVFRRLDRAVDLLFEIADFDDRVVGIVDPIYDPLTEGELLRQIRFRSRNAWVFQQAEGTGCDRLPGSHTYSVMARRSEYRFPFPPSRRPKDHAGEGTVPWIFQGRREAVDARIAGELFVPGAVHRGDRLAVCAQKIEPQAVHPGGQIVGEDDLSLTHTVGILRRVEGRLRERPGGKLAQQRDILENPERAAVGRGDEIVVLADQVVDRTERQVKLERLPVVAVVEAGVGAGLRAGIEKPLAFRVLAADAGEGAGRNAGGDFGPGLAEVMGAVEIGGDVVVLVIIDRQVGRICVVRRGLDHADAAPVRHVRRSNVRPGRAAVGRYMDQAVVGAGPDQAAPGGGFGDGEDRVVILDAGVVFGDRAAGGALPAFVVAGQVRADALPALAHIRGLEQILRGRVERVGIVRRGDDREGPLEPLGDVRGGMAHRVIRPWIDRIGQAGALVEHRDVAAVVAADDDVRVIGLDGQIAALATRGIEPVVPRKEVRLAVRTEHERGVVLLGAIDAIGKMVVSYDVIDLGGRERLLGPGLAAVGGDCRTAVVGLDHCIGIGRVDPQIVIIAVAGTDTGEFLAAVGRFEEADVQDIERVDGFGIGIEVIVVPGALAVFVVVVNALPGFAGVVGAEDSPVLRFHDRPDAVRLDGRDGDADLAQHAGRHARIAAEIGPGGAAVGGLVELAAGSAAVEGIGGAPGLPGGRVERIGIVRVHAQVHGAGAVALEEDLLPRLAAIRGLVDAALRVGAPDVAERGHIDDVRIRRIDLDAGNVLGGFQTDVLPGLAAVRALVDTISCGDVAADVALAHAGVDHVGIGGADGDGADGGGLKIAVGDARPGRARVGGFPQSAAGRAEIELFGSGLRAGHSHGPAPTRRSDGDPFQHGVVGRVVALRQGRNGEHTKKDCREQGSISIHRRTSRRNSRFWWRYYSSRCDGLPCWLEMLAHPLDKAGGVWHTGGDQDNLFYQASEVYEP